MIGLLGSGSWATAIVKILLEDSKRRIAWWVREEEAIPTLIEEKHNPLYLSEAYIDTSRTDISSDLNEVIEKSDILYLVVPSAFVDKALNGVSGEVLRQKHIVSAVKGIVPETNQIITDYLHSRFDLDYNQMCVVSGPSHAEEAARQKLTYLTMASPNQDFAEEVRKQMGCHYIKTTYSTDMLGIECAAVLKNIYAIAAGMCKGLGYGDNIIAVLISNATQEMTDFMQAMAPIEIRQLENFAYLGDLLVTCYSQFSRNRTFGNMVGYGYSIKGAQLEMKMVAEGYYAVKGIQKIMNDKGLKLPIVEAVYDILYKRKSPEKRMKQVIANLH